MHDYSACYATLGVTPDTDWGALRARYRRLIGQWHPDRYSANTARKAAAEEHCKQITLAYKALERYRRDHGVLPRLERIDAKTQSPKRDSSPASVRASSRDDYASSGTESGTHPKPGDEIPRNQRRTAVVFFALFAALSFAYFSLDAEVREDASEGTRPGVTTRGPQRTEGSPKPGGISTGSTLGEVHAIQGVPSLTQGDTWYYGKSRIRFSQGRVISWDEHPDNPLRIDRERSVQLHDRYFHIGSTKDEVRAIQGTPVTETDTVWDYAPSRVYFDHGRVTRWEESPVQPLSVRR